MKEKIDIYNKYDFIINVKEYHFETLINRINEQYGIILPNVANAYKETLINLKSKNVDFNSSLGKIIFERLEKKVEYNYNLLKQMLEVDDKLQMYKLKIYLLNYAYIEFYDLENELKSIMLEKYSGSLKYGYEPNFYIRIHMDDIIELQKMNLLDSFCEFELEIMNMICSNEQENLNYLSKSRKITNN